MSENLSPARQLARALLKAARQQINRGGDDQNQPVDDSPSHEESNDNEGEDGHNG